MKWYNKLLPLLCILLLSEAYASEPLIEKKKNISTSFGVDASDKVNLDNQFGDIRIKFWDKAEVRIDITITSNAPDDEKAANFIKTVVIDSDKNTGGIFVKTHINSGSSKYTNNLSWKGKSEDKTQLRIDYQVSMPKNNALFVKNSFGNIYLPNFAAPLSVDENYGTLFAENITGNAHVDVAFGKAIIKSMKGGDLKVSYSTLEMEEAENVNINNSFGKLNIKEITNSESKISYSSGTIGTMKEMAKLKIDFSGGLKFAAIDKTLRELEINSSYSSLTIPLDETQDYNFDVKVSYADFDYPSNRTISFTRNSDEEKKDKGFNPTKYYVGKIGKGNADTHIIIKSSFGSVKLK